LRTLCCMLRRRVRGRSSRAPLLVRTSVLCLSI
jgi:hypothetical protein